MNEASIDTDWKLIVQGLKTKLDPARRQLIEAVVREASGDEVPLRTARKGLLLMAVEALQGKPRMVDLHGEGVVVVIGLGALLDVLAEPAPTLGAVMEKRYKRKS